MGVPLRFKFLDAVLGPAHAAFVGDLQDLFLDHVESRGQVRASIWLWIQCFVTVPRILFYNLFWERFMFRNYLVVAIRQLKRHRSFSVINVLGLALSMSVCLLILSLLNDQKKFDAFHENGDRIYRVTSRIEESFGSFWMATSAGPLGSELAQLPEVEGTLQMRVTGGQLLREDGLRASFSGLYAEPSYFEFFDFALSRGNRLTALEGPHKVVLSADLAEVLFSGMDPIGQAISWDGVGMLEVSGVLASSDQKTHLRSDVLISFETVHALIAEGSQIPWGAWSVNSAFYNYLMLRPGSDPSVVERAAIALAESHHTDPTSPAPEQKLQSLLDINMGSELSNQISPVMSAGIAIVLSVLAMVLVFVAVFNYVSLTVSRSMRRAREIGIRKVVGAHRAQLVHQFVTEAVLTAILALGTAVLILLWLLPKFNALSAISKDGAGRQIAELDLGLGLQFLAFAMVLGLLAGILPALQMSRFNPVETLMGSPAGRVFKRVTLRKTLIVGQFAVSIVAIMLTVVLFRQAAFLMESDLGFEQEQLVHLQLRGVDYGTLRNGLIGVPGVLEVAATSTPPSVGSNTSTDIKTPDMEEPILIQQFAVDEHFLAQYRIELVAGRSFSGHRGGETVNSILLTEAAVAELGLGSPQEAIGTQLIYDTWSLDEPVTLQGVVKNFYSRGLEDGVVSVALSSRAESFRFAAIRIAPGKTAAALTGIQSVWGQLAPGTEASLTFFDEALHRSYSGMMDGVRILGMFCFMIVIIASLGLLGMASFSAETRLKEVGVRKVVGANTRSLIALLSREYFWLIGIAVTLAVPLGFVATRLILANFSETVSVGPLTVLGAVVPVAAIALLTVGSQTHRAAQTNPIEILRND